MNPHVLIIDDNTELLTILEIALAKQGYLVKIKNDTSNIFDTIREWNPGVILLDLNLGDANGYELCMSFKKHPEFSHIPVVIISAYDKRIDECLAAGADVFLAKPFEMNSLLTTVESLTASSY